MAAMPKQNYSIKFMQNILNNHHVLYHNCTKQSPRKYVWWFVLAHFYYKNYTLVFYLRLETPYLHQLHSLLLENAVYNLTHALGPYVPYDKRDI